MLLGRAQCFALSGVRLEIRPGGKFDKKWADKIIQFFFERIMP